MIGEVSKYIDLFREIELPNDSGLDWVTQEMRTDLANGYIPTIVLMIRNQRGEILFTQPKKKKTENFYPPQSSYWLERFPGIVIQNDELLARYLLNHAISKVVASEIDVNVTGRYFSSDEILSDLENPIFLGNAKRNFSKKDFQDRDSEVIMSGEFKGKSYFYLGLDYEKKGIDLERSVLRCAKTRKYKFMSQDDIVGLTEISEKYKMTLDMMKRFNQLRNPNGTYFLGKYY